jgi:GNAT superfamily N-acetyltransferase
VITIAHCEEELAHELHKLAFPSDSWVSEDFPDHEHAFWLASEGARPVGFCSAVLWDERKAVFLSRAAVINQCRGMGIHRMMIAKRVKWAWEQGVDRVVTYTTLQNYPSMSNLLDCGFRFYRPDEPWVGKRVHYFELKR